MTNESIETKRLELHEILCELLGSRHVYFQPPESIKMEYPSIRYARARLESTHADNRKYLKRVRYTLTFISRKPNDSVVDAIRVLPFCSHDRFYTAENLNHDVFTIYY